MDSKSHQLPSGEQVKHSEEGVQQIGEIIFAEGKGGGGGPLH